MRGDGHILPQQKEPQRKPETRQKRRDRGRKRGNAADHGSGEGEGGEGRRELEEEDAGESERGTRWKTNATC